jgi:hypothetical protein
MARTANERKKKKEKGKKKKKKRKEESALDSSFPPPLFLSLIGALCVEGVRGASEMVAICWGLADGFPGGGVFLHLSLVLSSPASS